MRPRIKRKRATELQQSQFSLFNIFHCMYKVGPLHTTVIFFCAQLPWNNARDRKLLLFQQMVDLQATELWDVLHGSL